MAKRSRAVRPDLAYELDDGRVIGVVSEDALQAAVADAVTVAMWSGGMVSVALNRHPTGVPHEMVTVGALVVWQDRDDAKPQPEPVSPAREVEMEPVEKVAEPVLEPDGSTGWDPTPEQLEAAVWRTRREDAALPATEELEEAVAVGVPVGVDVGEASYEQAMAAVEERFGPQPARETRTPRESGEGSGALPFQRGSTEPTARPEVDLSQVVRGDASSLPRGDASPAPAGSSEGIDDGLDAASLPDEDDSSIPESRR
jgi:hypothetical protein